MGRFDGFLICSDIDGTFASGGEVPARNLEALARFQAEGGRFTFATGRMAPYWEIFPLRPNAPVISANGTFITDAETGRTLWTFPLDGCGNLLEWLDGFEGKINLHYTGGYVTVSDGKVSEAFLNQSLGDLLKIVCFAFPDEAVARAFRDRARERFGSRYGISRSWDTGVEFISPLGGKGSCLNCLRRLCEDVHTVVAVGDYENDLSMLLTADRAFAPANACPEILNEAVEVVCSCENGSLGDVIDRLESSLS